MALGSLEQNTSKLEKLRSNLDKWLGLYVGLMIIIGLLAGYYDMGWVHNHLNLLQIIEMASIYIMIFQ